MIGTYYHAPAPGEPPFVQEGDIVELGTQIGILEAMKLMNPIEADRAGRVAKVLVADGTPVEFDQPLLVLHPAGRE
jgi:acetyl-CoA carboxylase biotin carboxyl carrier protein